jgi:hypothetical protein
MGRNVTWNPRPRESPATGEGKSLTTSKYTVKYTVTQALRVNSLQVGICRTKPSDILGLTSRYKTNQHLSVLSLSLSTKIKALTPWALSKDSLCQTQRQSTSST